MTKVKICGLNRPCDVDYINAALPDYCGFIIGFPASKRNVTVAQLRSLQGTAAAGGGSCGRFCRCAGRNGG